MKVTVNQLSPLIVTVEFEQVNGFDEDANVCALSAYADLDFGEIVEGAIKAGLSVLHGTAMATQTLGNAKGPYEPPEGFSSTERVRA